MMQRAGIIIVFFSDTPSTPIAHGPMPLTFLFDTENELRTKNEIQTQQSKKTKGQGDTNKLKQHLTNAVKM